MSGFSETYSTQRKIWKRAESSRYSGSRGIGSLREIGYRGSGSEAECRTGIFSTQPAPAYSDAFFMPGTDLGKSLWDLRTDTINSLLPQMSRDDVERVIRERRG